MGSVIKKRLHYILTPVAVASLGWIVGWFVGHSGSNSVVLAAVLPAVLSVGGVLAVFRAEIQNGHDHSIIMSLAIIVFVLFLYVGSQLGNRDRKITTEESLNKTLKFQKESEWNNLEFQLSYLERCSNNEYYVNKTRAKLGLPSLDSEVFCGGKAKHVVGNANRD